MIATVESQYALLELLTRLAQESRDLEAQKVPQAEPGDPPPSGSEDAQSDYRSRDELEDWEGDDAYAQEVGVPRFGPI